MLLLQFFINVIFVTNYVIVGRFYGFYEYSIFVVLILTSPEIT